jgi:hypothetical protein
MVCRVQTSRRLLSSWPYLALSSRSRSGQQRWARSRPWAAGGFRCRPARISRDGQPYAFAGPPVPPALYGQHRDCLQSGHLPELRTGPRPSVRRMPARPVFPNPRTARQVLPSLFCPEASQHSPGPARPWISTLSCRPPDYPPATEPSAPHTRLSLPGLCGLQRPGDSLRLRLGRRWLTWPCGVHARRDSGRTLIPRGSRSWPRW